MILFKLVSHLDFYRTSLIKLSCLEVKFLLDGR